MIKIWFICGGLFGFLSVAFGAFGAHALSKSLAPEMLAYFDAGIRYQMFHALALIALGIVQHQTNIESLQYSGWGFLFGILIFSGSLYMLALTGMKWLGALTPIGGILFLFGWGWFLYQIIKH